MKTYEEYFRFLLAGGFATPRDGRLQRTERLTCAVVRRCISAGEKPARQLSLQPEAVGAVQGGNELG